MHSRRKAVLSLIIGMGVSLGFLVTGVHVQSGSLEPPGSVVDGSGDPVATMQTQPSWDQTLPVAEWFVLVMGGAAVLDKETGLVWEQSPLTTQHFLVVPISRPAIRLATSSRTSIGRRR